MVKFFANIGQFLVKNWKVATIVTVGTGVGFVAGANKTHIASGTRKATNATGRFFKNTWHSVTGVFKKKEKKQDDANDINNIDGLAPER